MAVTGTAWAVTVPGLPSGFVYTKSRNEDTGSTYVVSGLAAGDTFSFDASTLVGGVNVGVSGLLNNVPTALTVTKYQANGALDADGTGPGTRLEDTWGIALVYHINSGNLTNPGIPGSIVGSNGGTAIYDNSFGAQGTWLTAMFHSAVDGQVVTTMGNGANGIPTGFQAQTVSSSGMQFELWAVDAALMVPTGTGAGTKDSVNLVDYGSRVDLDTYTGWTGDTLAGSVLLLDGTLATYAQSTVVVSNSTGQIVSNSKDASTIYFDVDPTGSGAWNQSLGMSDELLDMMNNPTNIWFQWTLASGQRGWNIHSDDIGGAFAIPEPLTMLGVFFGIGGVGKYIRRRMKVA